MDGLATERKFVPQIAIGNISDNGVWSGGGIMEYGLRHVPVVQKIVSIPRPCYGLVIHYLIVCCASYL